MEETSLVLDIHTHSIASGHAYGTIREMAQAASLKGLKLLGISEHGPGIPGTCNLIYFSNVGMVPRNLYGVEIVHGCEANVLNDGTFDIDEKHMEHLDYVIVGIHGLCYENEGIKKNTDHVVSCMKHPKVFFVSHPDDDHTPLDYERLVVAAKEYHVALEVNNSSFLKQDQRLHCLDNYRKMLGLCMQYETPIIVNSDAHDPSYVGRFQEAVHFLNEMQFDERLVLNTSVEKWKAFVGYKG